MLQLHASRSVVISTLKTHIKMNLRIPIAITRLQLLRSQSPCCFNTLLDWSLRLLIIERQDNQHCLGIEAQ